MNLTSHSFFLLFFPLSLLLFWGIFKSNKARLWLLLGISLLFYGLGGWHYVPLLLGLSLMTFLFARKGWFTAGLILNIAALAFFKFIGWEITIINQLGLPGAKQLLNLAFPLGLSYYTFKHIGYLLDVKWKLHDASGDFLTFATYSAFFPQISAGPLSSFADTSKQLNNLPHKLTQNQVFDSLIYITVGLAKKLLISNVLAQGLKSFIISPMTGEGGFFNAWLLVIGTAMQIYFDFSGYTDIVIGIAGLFGIKLPPNFNNPFLAKDIQDFWNRWHISVSKWFRVYVFFPLSRSLIKRWGTKKKGLAQTVANLATMFLVGLWHGVTFGNLLWGIGMGVLLSIQAWLKRIKKEIKHKLLARIVVLGFTFFGLAMFMSDSLRYAIRLFSGLLMRDGFDGLSAFNVADGGFFYGTLILSLMIAFSGVAEADKLLHIRKKWFAIAMGLLLALCIIALGTPVNFFYVQF